MKSRDKYLTKVNIKQKPIKEKENKQYLKINKDEK